MIPSAFRSPIDVFLIAVFTIGFGCGLSASSHVVVAAITAAGGVAIATIACSRYWTNQSPTKIVPVSIVPVFARRLTGSSVILGRKPCCDVVLPLPTVSGHHCRFHRTGRYWYVEDLASCNGTLVNNRRVRRKGLRLGDMISIGEFQFTIE